MDQELYSHITGSVDRLAVSLHDGVATGVASAREMLTALPNQDRYQYLLPLSARAFMREHWDATGLPDAWELRGNPRQMGQIYLQNDERHLQLRVLKERSRGRFGGVPAAGFNAARRAAWQSSLDLGVPGVPGREGLVRLLALWDARVRHGQTVLTLRVVHTRGPGVYGSRVPLDLSYEVRPTSNIFETLQFRGAVQDDDLFAMIDRKENSNEGGMEAR